MTPYQIKTSTTIQLIQFLKNKARCFHSRRASDSVWLEIQHRLNYDRISALRLAIWHMQNEGHESDYQIFDEECDKLIAHLLIIAENKAENSHPKRKIS